MKNFNLGKVDYVHDDVFEGCQGLADDGATGLVYIARENEVVAWNPEMKQPEWRVDWTAERDGSGLVDFQLLYDTAELAAILANGSLLLVNTETQEINVECVGCECSAASWCPDLSCLAVLDGVGLTFYDRMFNGFKSCELTTTERGKDEQVTVGWGSKDTQFQGSAGKAAREKMEEDKAAYSDDSGADYVRWRADGQFTVVSHVDKESGERRAIVFDKDGELLSRLKIEKAMEEVVAVRTVGNYIATTNRDSDGKRKLVFFERNGEKRHEYSLPTTAEEKIIDMAWDVGGTTLMIHYRGNGEDRLEMWTVSNYDWNCKWTHPFPHPISSCKWDTEKALVFSFVTSNGDFARLSFFHGYSSVGSISVVAATEGFRVTNFSRAPIPPPMSEYVIPSARPLGFAFNGKVFAVLDRKNVVSYEIAASGRLELSKSSAVQLPPSHFILSSATVFDNHLVIVSNGHEVLRIDPTNGAVTEVNRIDSDSPIIALSSHQSELVAVTADGGVHKLRDGIFEKLYGISPNSHVDVKCNTKHILILTAANELFLDGVNVNNSVGSFLVTDTLCIYITLQNKIMFADLEDRFKNVVAERAVELGSQLVCCVPEKMNVVMQMPRGNLETFYPRIFVVQAVRTLIEDLKYVEALRVMKKHRINMNILVDHDIEKFCENVSLLFGPSSDAEIVNLLTAALSNELGEWCSGKVAENKVERVTTLMQNEVLRLDGPERLRFFTVLLSALLKHSPPRVETALQYIKQHTDEMNADEKDVYSRQWLHHVGFFVDEKEMFNAALATYDLRLAVQVAEASNRDPREYLPMVNELRKVEPEAYRRYRIQMVREDWASALVELAELPDKFDEIVTLVKNKNLYAQALRVFSKKEKYPEICEIVAAHLEVKGQWSEAAALYQKAGNNDKTVSCLELSRNVSALLSAAARLHISVESLRPRLTKMAIQLEADGKWLESAKALRSSGASTSNIVNVLAKGGEWIIAVSESGSDTEVLRKLASSRAEQLISEIASRGETISKYASRLEVVRDIKEKRILNLKEGIECGRDLEEIDAFSEAGSTISMLSRRTGKTGTSRASTTATIRKRKQIERKKQSLKEGGEYEDSALLLALHEQYKWISTVSAEIHKLLSALVDLDEYSLATNLQSALESLCEDTKSRHIHIWPTKLQPKHLCGPLQGIYTVNDTFTFPEDGGMPAVVVIEPEMVPPPAVDTSSWKLTCLL